MQNLEEHELGDQVRYLPYFLKHKTIDIRGRFSSSFVDPYNPSLNIFSWLIVIVLYYYRKFKNMPTSAT
jgi:hypothetical protein